MPKYERDDNGYVLFPDVPISKSGVFQYLGANISPDLIPDKIYNVWRPESELNNPDTIKSFKLSPWIPYHEMLGEGFTAAENVGVEGTTGENVRYEGNTLYANLKLFGESLKAAIKNGLQELSCGFRCDWEVASGVAPSGEKYDAIQRNIRGNHLASVQQGRMGSDVRVALDRAVFALDGIDFDKDEGDRMTLEEIAAAITKQGEQLTAITTAMDGIKTEVAEVKTAQDKADEEKKKDDEEGDEKDADKGKEKSGAMDASDLSAAITSAVEAAVKPLNEQIESIKSSAMDAASIMQAMNEKTEFVNKLTPIIGDFDHSAMDKAAVAKYAAEKIGIACDSGHEVAMVSGYLAARQAPQFTVDSGAKPGAAQDAAIAASVDTSLEGIC